jgi:hypothetical protein
MGSTVQQELELQAERCCIYAAINIQVICQFGQQFVIPQYSMSVVIESALKQSLQRSRMQICTVLVQGSARRKC